MALAENTLSTRRPHPPLKPRKRGESTVARCMPDDLPHQYALSVVGDCMDPIYPDGSLVLVDRKAPFKAGDDVVLYLVRPGRPASEYEVILKRLFFGIMEGTTFPYTHNPASALAPLVVCEMLNPPRQFTYQPEWVLAIHRVVRRLRKEEVSF